MRMRFYFHGTLSFVLTNKRNSSFNPIKGLDDAEKREARSPCSVRFNRQVVVKKVSFARPESAIR